MNSFLSKKNIRIYIFIFLAFISIFVSIYTRKNLFNSFERYISEFSATFFEKTGLKFTYSKLSPSIISNFSIEDLQLLDIDENNILFINKVKINYNIFSLIKKDIKNGILQVLVDGIDFDLNNFLKIQQVSFTKSESNSDFSEILNNLPNKITLKNINFNFFIENLNLSTNYFVKNISFTPNHINNSINLNTESELKAKNSIFGDLSCQINLSGNITNNLEDSKIQINLKKLMSNKFKFDSLSFLTTYNHNKIDIHTIQSTTPLLFGATFNTKSLDLNVQLKSQNFKPITAISSNFVQKNKALKQLKETTFSTDTIFKMNFTDKTFNFLSDSSINLPKPFLTDGLKIDFSVFGDEKKVELSSLKANGNRCSLNSSLIFQYQDFALEGVLELPYFILQNGNQISTEVFFAPQTKGFKAFAPQIFVGQHSLNSLEFSLLPTLESYDFSLSLLDFSHFEQNIEGVYEIEGSFLNNSNYLQSNLTINNIFVDSVLKIASVFCDSKLSQTINKFTENTKNIVISTDCYLSSDLKSISYNIPYCIFANTKADDQAALISLNGSNSNVQINQLSLIFGDFAMEMSAFLDKNPESSEYFYSADIVSSSIPYHFSGTIFDKIITISGDYGVDSVINFNKNELFGHLNLENLPIGFKNYTFIFSTQTDFSYEKNNGPSVQISRFEIEQTSSKFSINPKIAFSGNIGKYGAQIDSIIYTDNYSSLEGNANIVLNINSGIFDSTQFTLKMENPIFHEKLFFDAKFTNPELLPFSLENAKKSLYSDIQLELDNFSLNRFTNQISDNNLISSQLFISGTFENPYISMNIENLSLLLASQLMNLNGNFSFVDNYLSILDLNVDFGGMEIKNIQADGDFNQMNMIATGEFRSNVMDKTITAPIELQINNVIFEQNFTPNSFSLSLNSPKVSGSFIKKEFPFKINAIYNDKTIAFYSSENLGINGIFNDSNILEMNINNNSFIQAKLDGYIDDSTMNLDLYDLNVDLQKTFDYIHFEDFIVIKNGILSGEIFATGNMDNPFINGECVINLPQAIIPSISKKTLFAPKMDIQIDNNEIHIVEEKYNTKNDEFLIAYCKILLNKWAFSHLEANVRTDGTKLFPLYLPTPLVTIKGDVKTNLDLYFENNRFEVTGKVFGENVSIISSLDLVSKSMNESPPENVPFYTFTDLDITFGNHVSAFFNPILRGVFVPNTSMRLLIDQEAEIYSINSVLTMRSGDISYLNRNFYIKSGSIRFERNNILDPIITIRAETREKDSKGENVTITMTAENQHLLNLQPKFTSTPPKSESELRTLLGQIVVADSQSVSNFLFAASDYAIQSTVGRQVENSIRDLLKFDIFSIRTNIIQNTLNMGVSGTLAQPNLSIGNFLDNSTIYVGKYLGSSLYLDAMLHITFDEQITQNLSPKNQMPIFQPEFGMELNAPFANIRVNMAPDIQALMNKQFIPSTSVTLSWNITF